MVFGNLQRWSLGCGKQHILDAISLCEQDSRKKGEQEQHSPWRLYFLKELFTPWLDCGQDPVSTDLIYKQIIRGLKLGEYQSDKVREPGIYINLGLCVLSLSESQFRNIIFPGRHVILSLFLWSSGSYNHSCS